MDLTTIFCRIDDFFKFYQKYIAAKELPPIHGDVLCPRARRMTPSEIMTVLVYYAASSTDIKHFKAFYAYKKSELQSAFPGLVSYERMTELKEEVLLPLTAFLLSILDKCTGISFLDSSKLDACHIKRAGNHKVLSDIAKRGKSSMGWFHGTKIHLAVNENGGITNLLLTSGNVADNNHNVIRHMTNNMFGKLFGDKGYILDPQFWQEIYENGVQIIHGLRKNMKKRIMTFFDRIMLRKRGIIECIFSILKERMALQYTRARSVYGFLCNTISMLIAYQLSPNKPKVRVAKTETSKRRTQVATCVGKSVMATAV
jgi:Transposase DDE domain.